MDLPLRYDITIPQRGTYRERFQIPRDCTDREVVAQVWRTRNGSRHRKMLDLEVIWLNRSLPVEVGEGEEAATVIYGDFYLVGEWEETAIIDSHGMWDLLLVEGASLPRAGERTYWLEGVANFNPGMSEQGQ